MLKAELEGNFVNIKTNFCFATAATVQPAAEERCTSDNPASATQNSSAIKTRSLEKNQEPEADHSGCQDSGEFSPQTKQGTTGTQVINHLSCNSSSLPPASWLHMQIIACVQR